MIFAKLLLTLLPLTGTPEASGSHRGIEEASSLTPVSGYHYVIPQAHLQFPAPAIYPRIKKLQNGEFLLFCQAGRIASTTYYMHSADLKTWSAPQPLFTPYPVQTPVVSDDTRAYSTTDGVVLANGDILAVTSFRAVRSYRRNIGNGLMTRRSTDNGRTWSDEQIIYEGTNWEPYLLQLPDGRIHCYFTDSDAIEMDSGTSVMVSEDNGHTWSAKVHCSRQYKFDNANGTHVHTDQMPSFRVLSDGRTILGFLEDRLQPDGQNGESCYRMSVVRNHSLEWSELLPAVTGPEDRDTNVSEGCAGYVSVFPSGEVVLSCNLNRKFSLKIGNSDGTVFNGAWDSWYQPFDGTGYWGSTEVVDDHLLIGTMHCNEGIEVGLFYLNHAIRAEAADSADCWQRAHALYLGSDQGDVTLKATRDGNMLRIRIQGSQLTSDAAVQLGTGDPAPAECTALLTPESSAFETSVMIADPEADTCDVRMSFAGKTVTSKIILH